MAKRRYSRKSSKCPEPINTLLDIAGAATLGLYAKHKIRKDFENGCGEESAKAAAMVFGMGSMRRGSQGTINLGGLIGLNSALKELENKQSTSNDTYYTPSRFVSPIEKAPAVSHQVPAGLWRKHCEDGSSYGLDPETFENADDYEDALKAAKEAGGCRKEKLLRIQSNDIQQSTMEKESRKYSWRKYCQDGTKYGLNPNDFETADDYNDAIEEAKRR